VSGLILGKPSVNSANFWLIQIWLALFSALVLIIIRVIILILGVGSSLSFIVVQLSIGAIILIVQDIVGVVGVWVLVLFD